MAGARGLCDSFKAGVSFLITPSLGSLSDTVGRKPVMYGPSLSDLIQRIIVLPFMSVPAEIVADSFFGSSSGACMSSTRAALSDMYVHDPAELGAWQSRLQMGSTACTMVTPILASWLASKSLRLPLLVSAVLCVLNLLLIKASAGETLPPSKRKPWVWRSSSPLSVLQLFRNGQRLAWLSAMMTLDYFVQPVLGGHNGILQVFQADRLGWGLMQRGRFESFSSIVSLPAFLSAPALIHRLGLLNTARLGIVSTTLNLVLNTVARSSWHYFVAVLVGSMSKGGTQALTALIASEGATVGLGQGEIQGMIWNLRSVVGMGSGLFWGGVFAFGTRRGIPALIFVVATVASLVQLQFGQRLGSVKKSA